MIPVGAVLTHVLREISGPATGALIAAVWQGVLLAGAAAVGLKLLPRTPAAARFAIWFSVFVVVAALPFTSVWTLSGRSAGAVALHPAWFTVDPRWSEAVLLLWIAASVARAVTLVVGAVRVHALWRRATPIQLPGFEGAGSSARGRRVQICTSDEVDRPSVIGFFAPKILIPTWLVGKLSPEEMEHVVLHEAGHLRRADDWLNLLQKIALVFFPLNPALAWVERRLCFERELACDEKVLNTTGAPKAYASCLASLAEHRMTRRGMALVMGALGRESELGQRMRRILSRGERMRPAHVRLLTVGAVSALLVGAVGLEQCPQLVGFGSGSRGVVGSVSLVSGADFHNVVYRQAGAAVDSARAIDAVVRTPVHPATASKTALSTAMRRPVRVVRTAAPIVPASIQRQPVAQWVSAANKRSENGTEVTGWVVMTTWSADASGYGARMVMTAVETGTAPETPGDSQNAIGTQVRQISTDAPLAQGRIRPVFSYAAVPVRGGWLVIQL